MVVSSIFDLDQISERFFGVARDKAAGQQLTEKRAA